MDMGVWGVSLRCVARRAIAFICLGSYGRISARYLMQTSPPTPSPRERGQLHSNG